MTQAHELVEKMELASDNVDAGLTRVQAIAILDEIMPLITHKAKEELLKQMMEPSAAVCEAGSNLERCPPITTSQADECFRAMLRALSGGEKKEKSVFKSEKEAYDFCRKAYRDSGGVTPELRRAYEFYLTNYNDDCDRSFEPPGR